MAKEGTCKAENCSGPVRAKGYCQRHYRKWRKGLMAKPRYRICTEEGCRKRRFQRSLCEEHWTKKYQKSEKQAESPTT